MKANEFVKKFGLLAAQDVISKAPEQNHERWYFFWCKECGYGGSSEALLTDDWTCDYCACPACGNEDIQDDQLTELKRLVESHELVEKHGGLFQSKVQLDKFGFSGGLEWYGEDGEYGLTDDDLRQAIADVESCL